MITMTGWQLVGIIIGSVWVGSFIGLGVGCLLAAAGRTDDAMELERMRQHYERLLKQQ